MEYTEFLEELRAGMEKQMGGRYKILIKSTLKENGKRVKGVGIYDREKSGSSPMIYGEAYYQDYLENGDMDKCVNDVINVYNECKHKCFEDVDSLNDWEKCKNWVYPFIINKDMNKELLKKLVYRTYLDFAICYMIRLPQEESDSHAISRIRYDMLDVWGIGNNELHDVAIQNLKNDGYKIVNMLEMASEILDIDMTSEPYECDMYVLYNKLRRYGAAGILDEERLEKFADMVDSDFYILPSSLHEVILIPCKNEFEGDRYNQMVRDVNDEIVDLEEILSDHSYYYDRQLKQIKCL